MEAFAAEPVQVPVQGQGDSLECNPVGRAAGLVVGERTLVAVVGSGVLVGDVAGRVAEHVTANRGALADASWWVSGRLHASRRWGSTRSRVLGLVGRIVERRTGDGFRWDWHRRLWRVLAGGRRSIVDGGSRDQRVVERGG